MKYVIEQMRAADIPEVLEVDRESYPIPWPASAYRRELGNHQHARYIVLRAKNQSDSEANQEQLQNGKAAWKRRFPWTRSAAKEERPAGTIVGYAGMWLIADEAHVTTIAVRETSRGRGFGELLLASLIRLSYGLGVRWVTLEVRVTNETAQTLYRKYGFRKAGLRKRYYSDNNEDALIMTTDDITLNAYQLQFDSLIHILATKLQASSTVADAPVFAEPDSVSLDRHDVK